jgi:membrane-bound lytic murein transglycosylase B
VLTRRRIIACSAPALLAASSARAQSGSFQTFLAGLRAEAERAGIRAATLNAALVGLAPNQKVLDRDRHQPEFTMTWAKYRSLLLTDQRIGAGQAAVAQNRALLQRVEGRFGVDPGVITGIWGLESSFGTQTGDFRVVDALATLAWDGRRASYFRGELMAALKIVDHGDVAPARMTGSYAGAMGQPQFMPSSYLRYAVDFEGHGRRDIWTSLPDVFGSIANYLAKSGWHAGESWGQQVVVPAGFDPAWAGRDAKKLLSAWVQEGVRPLEGRWFTPSDTQSAVVMPDGAGGEAFIVHANFTAIRRYNPSDYYALLVGLLGDRLVA